jgi:hypothetical protein
VRAEDVVRELANRLPQRSGAFTTNVEIRAVTRAGTTMTAECEEEHGLEAGSAVAIVGAVTPLAVSALTRLGAVGTVETTNPHDLTAAVATTIELVGAVEPSFVGTFQVLRVVNRRTIEFSMADAGPLVATGTIELRGAASALQSYNGTYGVLDAPTPTSFRFTHPKVGLANPVGEMQARARPRISSGVSPDRVAQAYTEQKLNDLWLFAVLADVEASKSRLIKADAVDNLTASTEFRQQLAQNFALYLYIPTSEQLTARAARDLSEELFRPICQSILFAQLDSLLYVGRQGRVQFVGHGFHGYNSAVYVHSFAFQQVVDLTFEDSTGPDLDVAFRDIDLAMFPVLPVIPDGAGTEAVSLDAHVDLDEEPEP